MSVWTKIERAAKTKIPEFLKGILKENGFDTEWSILNLKDNNLESIENFINENKDNFRRFFEGTKYENCETFRFDIGDRNSLLSLQTRLKEIKEQKLEQKRRLKDEKKLKNIENFDASKLKQELLSKIKQYWLNKSLEFRLSEKDIVICEIKNGDIRCVIQCPTCKIRIPCWKPLCWKFGNFITHVNSKHAKQISSLVIHYTENADDLEKILR